MAVQRGIKKGSRCDQWQCREGLRREVDVTRAVQRGIKKGSRCDHVWMVEFVFIMC